MILIRDYVAEWDWEEFRRTVKAEEKRESARKQREQAKVRRIESILVTP